LPGGPEKPLRNLVRLADARKETRKWHFWYLRQDCYRLLGTVVFYVTKCIYIYVSSSHSYQMTIKELMIMLPLHGKNTAVLQLQDASRQAVLKKLTRKVAIVSECR
jgi:hypothetical protein